MTESGSPLRRLKNLSITSVAGLAGCMIVIGVMASLLAGLWLDARFGMKGPFTIGLVTLTAPLILFIVLRIVLRLVRAIQPPPKNEPNGTNSLEVGGYSLKNTMSDKHDGGMPS